MTTELEKAVREAEQSEEIPQELVLAFAPLHKRAVGMAIGLTLGGLVCVLTVIATLFPENRAGPVGLLSQYFAGYTVSWTGAFVGLAWGWFVGFVGGWFVAFCRNFILAVQIWIARARHELQATRDFLDHI